MYKHIDDNGYIVTTRYVAVLRVHTRSEGRLHIDSLPPKYQQMIMHAIELGDINIAEPGIDFPTFSNQHDITVKIDDAGHAELKLKWGDLLGSTIDIDATSSSIY